MMTEDEYRALRASACFAAAGIFIGGLIAFAPLWEFEVAGLLSLVGAFAFGDYAEHLRQWREAVERARANDWDYDAG